MGDEEKRRDLEIEKRFQELEADLAAAESDGGKKADMDKLRKASEKDVEAIR